MKLNEYNNLQGTNSTERKANITKKEVMAAIKSETERLHNISRNIVFAASSSKGHEVVLNKKQFVSLLDQMISDDGYLHPNYDDDDVGVDIYVNRCLDRKRKTIFNISI